MHGSDYEDRFEAHKTLTHPLSAKLIRENLSSNTIKAAAELDRLYNFIEVYRKELLKHAHPNYRGFLSIPLRPIT